MNLAIRNILVYPAVLLFLAVNLWLMTRDVYVLNLLPVALLLAVIAFLSLDRLLLIIVFYPSFHSSETPGGGYRSGSVSSHRTAAGRCHDPFILKVIREKSADLHILLHPLAVVIYIYLFWMVVTSLTSTLPLVSVKHTLARMWFVTGYFFVAAHVFRDFRNIKKYLWAYILSLTIVIFYTLFKQYQYGLFNQQASHSTVHPFYNDHTAYGAALAFLIPVLAGFVSGRNGKTAQDHPGDVSDDLSGGPGVLLYPGGLGKPGGGCCGIPADQVQGLTHIDGGGFADRHGIPVHVPRGDQDETGSE